MKFPAPLSVHLDTNRGLYVASVRVLALAIEDFLIKIDVVVINGIVESNRNHHWDVLGRQISGHGCAILRAEAIRKNANGGIAGRRPVWIVVNICNL